MAYTSPNILRQLRHYQNIRKVGGVECVSDVYAKDPNTTGKETRFWFVGKMARCTGGCNYFDFFRIVIVLNCFVLYFIVLHCIALH